MAYNRKDGYYKKAKEEGYRSRASFKLLEIDKKHKLFRKGAKVLDLGCAPGGWLQVASAKVGPPGRVVGVDRLATDDLELANTSILLGDIESPDTIERLGHALNGLADLVLSDMAPDTSGVAFTDHSRSVELVEMAARTAGALLKNKGTFCAKVFDGPDLNGLTADLKKSFAKVKRIRPAATRKGSKELYILCTGHKRS